MDVDKVIDKSLQVSKSSLIYTAWCVVLLANTTLDGLLWLVSLAEDKVEGTMEDNNLKPPYRRKKVGAIENNLARSDTTIISSPSPEVEGPCNGIDEGAAEPPQDSTGCSQESQSCAGEPALDVPVTDPQPEDNTSTNVH